MEMPDTKRPFDLNGVLESAQPFTGPTTFAAGDGPSVFAPRRRFDPRCPELLDRPGMDRASLREELQALESFNRQAGGHWLMLRYVKQFVASYQPVSLNILDLGTGPADVPRALVAWARQSRRAINITAVDGNPEILQFARESCRDWPEIRCERHDLRILPYARESFDLVLCSLTLHHFTSADAITILRQIQTLARGGYIVNDLRRNWLTIWATKLMTRVLRLGPIFRNDALQSCRAAFTVRELRGLAERAGLNHFQIEAHQALCRMVLTGRK
jgi:SAM-dependent methyltransferase